jgi:hypothetical protein
MRDRRLQAVEAIVERQDPPASHDARGGETSCVGQRRPDLDKRRRSSILETRRRRRAPNLNEPAAGLVAGNLS